jgi:uncharacterized protein YbbK (DUF523 family)
VSSPAFSSEQPLRILASGCLAGEQCGYDGTSYGEHALVGVMTQGRCRVHPAGPE